MRLAEAKFLRTAKAPDLPEAMEIRDQRFRGLG